MKIVYCSNTGFTKEYALMLSKKLNIEAIDIKKYDHNEPIIYMGWVFGNGIMGYNKINKNNILCTVAVGMNFKSEENSKKIIETNQIKENFFYLQGGINYTKLKGIKKILFKMATNSIIQQNKKENAELIKLLKNGGNFVKEEHLNEIINYINQNSK